MGLSHEITVYIQFTKSEEAFQLELSRRSGNSDNKCSLCDRDTFFIGPLITTNEHMHERGKYPYSEDKTDFTTKKNGAG